MATPFDPKQVDPFEEFLISQVVQEEALIRLFVEKEISTKEEFLGTAKQANNERKKGGYENA